MKKLSFLLLGFLFFGTTYAQNSAEAKSLLDEVSTKMGAYENMFIEFSQTLVNEEAGIQEGDEAPIRGEINIKGEKYHLIYLGNDFIFDGSKLYIINHDDKEVNVSEGDLESDGFIYPSKLLTFYKEGYNYKMGEKKNLKGRHIQFVELNPIDSASDIVKVELGIDAKTKHIYKLIQSGANGSKTSFTITKFKSNQVLSENIFAFDKEKYLAQKYTID